MSTKRCLQCGKECEILPVQLGDVFTLSYLRICSSECMFLMAYDYLYDIGYHKTFRGFLYDKQNEEDKLDRDRWVNEVTEESLRMMREHFQTSPNLLSTPIPEGMLKMFAEMPPFPEISTTMKFTRPSKKDRIKWQSTYVDKLKKNLQEAMQDLEKLGNER